MFFLRFIPCKPLDVYTVEECVPNALRFRRSHPKTWIGVAPRNPLAILGSQRPRMTRSFKKARLRWSEDGRRVYFDEEGEEMDPFRGRRSRGRPDGMRRIPVIFWGWTRVNPIYFIVVSYGFVKLGFVLYQWALPQIMLIHDSTSSHKS